jgi:AcrR family transcriptional regulator
MRVKDTVEAPRTRMRGADRQRLIQERAAELFAARGYQQTSMQDIGDAVGVMKGTLYHFYKTKELLLCDILREAIGPPQREMDEIVAMPIDEAEKVERLIRALVRYHRDLQPYMATFTRETVDSVQDPDVRADLRARQRRFERTWEDAIRSAMEVGAIRADLDHRLISFGLIGMINWMYQWYSPTGRASSEDIASTFAAMVLDGLRPR